MPAPAHSGHWATERAAAIAAVVLDTTQRFDRVLTAERVFGWHAAPFLNEGRGRYPITVGGWRTDAHGRMIVALGRFGRETVHFKATPARDVPAEMGGFLRWAGDPADGTDPVLKAALAHVWFVTSICSTTGTGASGRPSPT